jgi:hypothetical protein
LGVGGSSFEGINPGLVKAGLLRRGFRSEA